MEAFVGTMERWYRETRRQSNQKLAQYEPVVVVITVLVAWEILKYDWRAISSLVSTVNELGLKGFISKAIMDMIKCIPGGAAYLQKKRAEVIEKMQSSQKAERECWQSELPSIGLGSSVLEKLKAEKSRDKNWQGKCSGAVYIAGGESEGHFALVNEAYSLFSHTNPLHPDIWPSVARFEAEVVAMAAALYGSKSVTGGDQICGNMTSGGTESILMAVKTTREYMNATRGITKPEMIIPGSAHSAYDKAAQYFKIKLRRAPVGADLRADVKAVKKLINSQTIMIVGSAPGFPHGVIDPIEELGALALKKRICFHVDLCLGGFVLPFARKLGYPIPPFDFTVSGVTSISTDVHKYGLGPKGTSVVLYRNHDLRKHQFVAVTEWSGGLYISPSMAGSRSGGLIAGAWASLMAVGENGFLEATRKLMDVSQTVQKGIKEISGLYILGQPDITVVSFSSDELDIYKVNDAMTARGWSLNALQRPSSLHICLTLQHVEVVNKFLHDLAEAVVVVQENPGGFEHGMAPIYGAAAKMPDRGTINDILVDFMDKSC